MHSSTLDSCTPSSCSPTTRDGGEVLVAVATLVTEGRIPIIQSSTKRCGLEQHLTNNSYSQQQVQGSPVGGGGGGKAQQHQRGFYEGPHCNTLSGMGGGSPQRGGAMGSGAGLQGMTREHCCNPADALCQEYEKVRSEVLNLWQKGIPLCVEVFLKHTCSCDVSLDDGPGSLLLERWYLSVSHFRTPSDSSPSNNTPTTFNNFTQLMSAIRSQLYFSQISAWLSPTTAPAPPAPISFHYRLAVPGETFDPSSFTRQPTHTHTFPSTDLGNGLLLNIQLETLPRVERVPALKCPRCEVGDPEVEPGGDTGGRRSTSPGEAGALAGPCGLFDDRMHTRCTLKGKHRCDDLDDFDNPVSKTEPQILGGKYKRLCHNETGEKRSPQRATFTAATPVTSTPSRRRLSSAATSSCDCQHQQQQQQALPSTSAKAKAAKCCYNDGFDSVATSEDSSPAKVNKGIRFCYQSFSDVLGEGAVIDGPATDTLKVGVDVLNQNEKRNSVQLDVDERTKAPKLDLADRITPLEINVLLDGLAVIPFDLNKPPQNGQPHKTSTTTSTSGKGDYFTSSILRSCHLQHGDTISDLQQQQQQEQVQQRTVLQATSDIGNNGKCDVKCVHSSRLGRIGTSILHGCARALQTVSDTTATNGDIFNLSQNSRVINDTVYVDETHPPHHDANGTTQYACAKPCKIRDISNTSISQSTTTAATTNAINSHNNNKESVRRKLTFHDTKQLITNNQFGDTGGAATAVTATTSNSAIEIPSPLDKAQFRKSLDNAASMVFHARTGLPLTSSPAPVRRGNTRFEYDSSIDSVSAIKCALFSGSVSTDDDSESDGSIVSPCSPDAFLSQPQATSYYSHATVLAQNPQQHYHVKNGAITPTTVQQHQQQHHHSNRKKTTSSSHLLGTFEESALNGRLEPAATVHGFKAELGASGAFVPPHRIVPVTVFFYTFGDSEKVTSPYLGHINLGKKGYNVPRTGTVQVTLFNPLGTVVKMFVIMYDLADMPNNAQTFIRQRTLYMPTNCKDPNLEWGPKWLRYLIHLRFMSSKSGKIYLHSDIRMIIFRKCDLDTATAHGMDMCYELRSFTHMPQNPKYSPRK